MRETKEANGKGKKIQSKKKKKKEEQAISIPQLQSH